MIKHIGIFFGNNLYDTKKHFSIKLSEALNRFGIQTSLYDMVKQSPFELFRALPSGKRPDMCCSFHSLTGTKKYGWNAFQDEFQIPFLNILSDPPTVETEWMAKDSLISCVDHFDCEYFRQAGFNNVFFWGHGVERELKAAEVQERPYDVVYMGTSYDPDGLEQAWSKFSEQERRVISDAIDLYFNDEKIISSQAVERVIDHLKIELPKMRKNNLFYQVGSYIRAIDRLKLIQSVKDARVYIFGGACFRPPGRVKGWQEYFAGNPHVTVHPAIPMDAAIEIMKKSKICLNSMPFFKNGTHERLFLGAACGCLMVNTDTLWVRNHFEEDLVLYKPRQWSDVNDKINYYLAHEAERKAMAEKARERVMRYHTWDKRVEELLEALQHLGLGLG